jgi:molecular chaperone DnaK (HSP70)
VFMCCPTGSTSTLDPAADPRLRANLRTLAEAAKIGLSDAQEVQLRWVGFDS